MGEGAIWEVPRLEGGFAHSLGEDDDGPIASAIT